MKNLTGNKRSMRKGFRCSLLKLPITVKVRPARSPLAWRTLCQNNSVTSDIHTSIFGRRLLQITLQRTLLSRPPARAVPVFVLQPFSCFRYTKGTIYFSPLSGGHRNSHLSSTRGLTPARERALAKSEGRNTLRYFNVHHNSDGPW